jgi:hypothetical protein
MDYQALALLPKENLIHEGHEETRRKPFIFFVFLRFADISARLPVHVQNARTTPLPGIIARALPLSMPSAKAVP